MQFPQMMRLSHESLYQFLTTAPPPAILTRYHRVVKISPHHTRLLMEMTPEDLVPVQTLWQRFVQVLKAKVHRQPVPPPLQSLYSPHNLSLRFGSSVALFNFDCLFKQFVTEWVLPSERALPLMHQLNDWFGSDARTSRFCAHLPIEIRWAKPDQALLSPGAQRTQSPLCWIGIISYRPFGTSIPGWSSYFDAFSSECAALGGRPHLAKVFSGPLAQYVDADKLAQFQAVRSRLDRHGVFQNEWTQRHL